MMLTDRVARGIASGDVTQVFRRWARPRVRAGGTLRTSAGTVEITAVDQVEAGAITDADARAAGEADADAVLAAFRGAAHYPVFRIAVRFLGPDDRIALSGRTDPDAHEVAEITAALARLDRASRRGPWTAAVLDVIVAHPGRRAGDLADLLGRDRESLKLDVRKLKNLGLTRSLEVGYEISPRGQAYLRATGR
ncbi:hypothetical protein ACFWM1_28715 [Nocardia sp. NPDC058379]|uniref:hypothetical protein n=1 Tax=unclassified Nocardia TaxID=2637762 RepID=UPI0036604926